MQTKTIIDLGCGDRKIENCIGVDIQKFPCVNLIADLEKDFPFKSESIDEFYAMETLEHLSNPIHTMNEIYRCLKIGGKLHLEVPSTTGLGAFQDPTHKSFWNQNSFWYYSDLCRHYYPSLIKCRFSVDKMDVVMMIEGILQGISFVKGVLTKLPNIGGEA